MSKFMYRPRFDAARPTSRNVFISDRVGAVGVADPPARPKRQTGILLAWAGPPPVTTAC